MEHFLADLVSRFGYAVVLLGVGIESMGVPVPGETALVIGAVAAAQGRLSPEVVAICGLVGAVAGDNTGYWVGRRWGRRLVRVRGLRRLYDERRIAVADRLFDRYGWAAVFLGRFVAILRIFAGPLAGMHRMRWGIFLVANAAGGAVWVAAVVTVGLLVGRSLDRAVSLVRDAGYLGLAVVAVALAGLVALHVVRTRRERLRGERVLAERRRSDVEEPW